MLGVNVFATTRVGRRGRVGDRPEAHAGDAHALWRALPHELEIGDQRFHLAAFAGQVHAIHAAAHAAVDPARQRQHLIVDHHREGAERGHERRGERLKPRVQMAVLAGKVVAGIAHGRIGRVLADIAGRVDDQILAVTDKIVLRARAELGDIGNGGIPIGWRPPQHIADADADGDRKHQTDLYQQRAHDWPPSNRIFALHLMLGAMCQAV